MYETEGIILRRRKVDESNCYLTMLCKGLGKISVYVKNGNNPKNPLNKAAQPFVYGLFTLRGAKSYTLSQAEIYESFYALRLDLPKLALASYMTAMVDAVLKDQETSVALYELVIQSLYLVNKTTGYEQKIRLFFEVNLLKTQGYRPNLEECLNCHQKKKPYYLSISQGGVVCGDCPQPDQAMILPPVLFQLLHFTFKETLRNFMDKEIHVSLLEKLDIIINSYMKYHLDLDMDKMKTYLQQY